MSESTETERSLIDGLREYRTQWFAIWILAIFGTIVGDTVFDALKSISLFNLSGFWWGLLLFIGASLGMGLGAGIVADWLERRSQHPPPPPLMEKFSGWDGDVPPMRALIAFVSEAYPESPRDQRAGSTDRTHQDDDEESAEPRKPGDSHRTAVEYHLSPPNSQGSKLSFVYLIASEKSKALADAYKKELDDSVEVEVNVLVYSEDVDFYDLATLHGVVSHLIEVAEDDLHKIGQVAEIVIDVTGGTKVATMAGTFAGRDRDVALEYIEPGRKNDKPSYEAEDITVRLLEFEEISNFG